METKSRDSKAAKNALQKMYLLSEPAFRKMKEDLDAEKFLDTLDKQLKSILYNNKLPSYIKWLKYKNVLNRYANFKKFLTESKANKDHESVKKFAKLEQRLKELEKEREQKRSISFDKTTPKSTIQNASEFEIDERNLSKDFNQLQPKQLEEEVFENDPTETNYTRFYSGTSSGGQPSVAHESSNTRIHDNNDDDVVDEETEYEPISFNFLNESDENQKRIDDQLISGKTIREQLDHLPPNIRFHFLNNDGNYPEPKFRISSMVTDESGKNKIETETINPLDAKILGNNTVKVKHPRYGWFDFPQVLRDDYFKLRHYLVEFQSKIRREKSISEQDTVKMSKFENANPIPTKLFAVVDFDKNSKVISYNSHNFRVSNEIYDNVVQLIETRQYTGEEMKEIVKMAENELQKQKETQKGPSYNDPLNRSSLMDSSQLLSANNKTIQTPSTQKKKSEAESSTAAYQSTPASAHDAGSKTPIMKGKQLFQPSVVEVYRNRKKTPNKQLGKGNSFKWERI